MLVAAPTGSGKTVVGEMAVTEAIRGGGRVFYTTPIKALSNQKFNDFRRQLGHERLGLLTGDHSIHPDAPVVVMTTEVLRNMLYGGSAALEDLQWVVLDEVHFLQDSFRGPVWEEVLIHSPLHVRFVCLSATVSNASELGEWIESIRGPTTTVVEHRRPVRLDCLYMVGDRTADLDHLIPLLVDGAANPEGHRFDLRDRVAGGAERGRSRSRFRTPRRVEVVDRLADEHMLPAIYFVFSRSGCESAVAACRDAGVRLTDRLEAREIREVADRHGLVLNDGDLDVLGFDLWRETLATGVAAHHAGMIPAFREAVEECFAKGLVKIVFATETLALGINMPARSVVVERLTKFSGDGHDMLTPAQFTQLTGRAGRRGMDRRGSAIVLWSPFLPFARVAGLAASKEYELRSAFRPGYNMAVNLVARYAPGPAREVLARSFARFQTDRRTAHLHALRDERLEELSELDSAICELSAAGPSDAGMLSSLEAIDGYLELMAETSRAERASKPEPEEIARALAALKPGDVVQLEPGEPDPGSLAVVVAVSHRRREVRVDCVVAGGRLRRLRSRGLQRPVEKLARVDLPVPYLPHDKEFRQSAAELLGRIGPRDLRSSDGPGAVGLAKGPSEARRRLEANPLHAHPEVEGLVSLGRRRRRLMRDAEGLDRRLARRQGDLTGVFDRVLGVLEECGQVLDWRLTPSGERLRRIYHESDLLVSLAIEDGLFDGLDAAQVACLVSCLTHEHRSPEAPPPPRFPDSELRHRFGRLEGMAAELRSRERASGLNETRPPSAGFAMAAHGWASGAEFVDALGEEMSGGDFVRNIRLLIDLLRQLRDVCGGDVARSCGRAAEIMRRDVVEVGGAPA